MYLKFKEPQIIRATYRIVTPMFIGDAEQKASGISPTSVKGALRFWWRALNWGRVYRSAEQSESDALQRLHEEESALFGSSAENGKRASFVLRLDTTAVNISRGTDWPSGKQNDASSYLGLGLWQMGQQAQREYIKEGQQFTVSLLVDNDVSGFQMKALKTALKLWGLVGGLGSRSRRAFGSIAIESLDQQRFAFASVDTYVDELTSVLGHSDFDNIELPPFSAIGKTTQVGVGAVLFDHSRAAHAGLGYAFKEYRGQPSSLRGPKKRVFGMPYSGGGREELDARRASPLFMHVHPVGKHFVATSLFLPSVFHSEPSLEKVDFSLASGFLKAIPQAVVS